MRNNSEFVLRKQKDFNRVYKKGKSKGNRFTVILYRKNGLDYTRTAYVASKKVGNSVARNRSRRLIRESFNTFRDNVIPGYDIIFVARKGIDDHSMQEVSKCIYRSVKECGLINKA
jgi:ribonuclease P protein component